MFAALAINRRWQQRNPGKRGYRWGYYFSIVSVAGGLLLGTFLGFGATGMILCGLLYGLLALSFARRCHWAWIALTILSFNPVVWIINAIYLWKRWSEEPQQRERTDCAMLTWNFCRAPATQDAGFH
jgi:hypothetical protein